MVRRVRMTVLQELPAYDENDLKRWYYMQDLARSAEYLDRVRILEVSGARIAATVMGTARRPYAVHIAFERTKNGELHLSAECSCPVGWMCKHTAAVLRVLLDQKVEAGAARVSAAVLHWLEELRASEAARAVPEKPRAASKEALFYLLEPLRAGEWGVRLFKARLNADGAPSASMQEWDNIEKNLLKPAAFVREEDLAILRGLWDAREGGRYHIDYPLRGEAGDRLLQRILATGRALAGPPPRRPLALGEARCGRIEWRHDAQGRVLPRIVIEDAASDAVAALAIAQLWYVDAAAATVGPLKLPHPEHHVAALMRMPPLTEADLPVVAGALAELAPHLPPPAPPSLTVIDTQPTPVLRLGTLSVYGVNRYRDYPLRTTAFDYAALGFRYAGHTVEADSTVEFITPPGGETVHIKRKVQEEKRLLARLTQLGLSPVAPHQLYLVGPPPAKPMYGLQSEAHWPAFMTSVVPMLREQGWEIEIPPGFRHHVLEVEAWEADIAETENGWFNLDMGIVVEGRRLPLAPLLHTLFHNDARWLSADKLAAIGDDEAVDLFTPEGARIRVPAGRLKPIARTLIDLFDAPPGDVLRLPRLDAPRLAKLAALPRWQFKGDAAVRRLAERLSHQGGIEPVAPPKGFAIELRPYQMEGLAWLQYLRRQDLAGILADDMGLGKTAQTLAHLLLEKESGRLDCPALVVLPTSLIFNWKREAERFAPGLKVLSLHGPERVERFAEIPAHDVCLTTYPLLWRDIDRLAEHPYHLLILDEAQTVKNAASQSAQAVRKLMARHRLCLTGTPLENHLGELWAQFDFLLPGFLGDAKGFARTWRTPIEKHGDSLRRDLLAARIRPFILRRRKEDVASELPPKTVIVRSVELEGGQRDLYEAVRAAMDVRIREEIAAKGFNRSQIVILDALLKLRQVCCDPRLLKLPAAQKVKERAKLDLLMDILPEMVEEGRRILLFSQFTRMLALIQDELEKRTIPYVRLTGDTRDREDVIRRFQAGQAPVFLISLKAGGVGLNLTAADTVIHYDPWWNPAVENQATDRAHRLGQTKKVFVYKLVVAGSIEEKILALQEKKAELAAGVLSEDGAALSKFSEADIAALLAPLPAER